MSDARIAREAPPCFPTWPAEKVARWSAENPYLVRADSLGSLAAACGMEPDRLEASVATYNAGLAGPADPFGRQYRPLPVLEPPYTAIGQFGIALKTYAGLRVAPDLRVLQDGVPFANLFAPGEISAAD